MKKSKTKIIHLVGSLNPGGVQTYILNVAKYDTVHNIEREVWTLYQKGGLLTDEFLKNNVRASFCLITPQDRNWKPYLLWKRLRNLARIFYFFRFLIKLKRKRPDLIILDEPTRILTHFTASKFLNIPVVWNIHAEKSLVANKLIFKWMYRYFLKNKLRFMSVSKYILLKNLSYMEEFLFPDFENIPIVHATVDLDKFLSIDRKYANRREDVIIGSVGRLNWAKGYDLLIESLSVLKKNHPNFQVKIVGEGPYRSKLENMIDQYSLKENVFILGELHYKDIPEFYNSINLYIQPSISEGSPITLKEAMASSLPILASTAGGIPEIIDHNETGILFEKGNKKELEIGLEKIVAMDNVQREKMGKKARECSIKYFDIKKTTDVLNNIYKSIIDET